MRAGVAALFHFVPNTRVRWRHALAGGLFVADRHGGRQARCWRLYFGAVPSFSMIYGAFATLPIFLVWIYLGWVIVLLGAVIAAYAPLLGRQPVALDRRTRRAVPSRAGRARHACAARGPTAGTA